MRIRKYRKKRDRPMLLLKIALIFALLALCVNLFYNRIRPMIVSAMHHKAKVTVTEIINSAVLKTLSQSKIEYGDLISVSRSVSGQVTSIETNSASMNAFKTKVLAVVLSEIRKLETQTLDMPIGSLSDVPFLLGKGPNINFRMSYGGYANAEFASEFFSAGINQTCHRIKLIIVADMHAFIPGFSSSVTVTTDFYVAETIIVGATPDFFAAIG